MKTFLLSFVIVFFMLFNVQAEEQKYEDWSLEGFDWQQIPVVCSTKDHAKDKLKRMGFTAQEYSLGRQDGDPNGAPVYMITTFYDEDRTKKFSMLTLPGSEMGCLLYYTFDVITEVPEGFQE